MNKIGSGGLLLSLLLGMAACSDAPKTAETPKEPPKPEEPLTGRQAFYKIFPQARAWAPDAQPLQVRSIELAEVKPEKGKAGAWQAIFVSPSRAKSKSWTYSILEGPGNLHQGSFAGSEGDWTGSRGTAQPFAVAGIKFDSDQAYEEAAAKSGAYIQKNPDKPTLYLLEMTNRFPDLTWRVIWGESVSTSDYSVFVDATTGKYLEISH
jgi:hypothetical protein